jgi:hypothetical protein
MVSKREKMSLDGESGTVQVTFVLMGVVSKEQSPGVAPFLGCPDTYMANAFCGICISSPLMLTVSVELLKNRGFASLNLNTLPVPRIMSAEFILLMDNRQMIT